MLLKGLINLPPKKQIFDEQILNKAYTMTKQCGYEFLTVRKLANELGCSTQPIYQAYTDMNALKIALIKKAEMELNHYIEMNCDPNKPILLAKLLAYAEFAQKEKSLYKLIFASDSINNENFHSIVPKELGVKLNMLIYVHGMVMMNVYNSLDFSPKMVKRLITEAYYTFCGGK